MFPHNSKYPLNMTCTIMQYNTHVYTYTFLDGERERVIVELVKQLKNESVDFLNVKLGIENELTNVVHQTLLPKRRQVREAPSPTERRVSFFLSGEETRQN